MSSYNPTQAMQALATANRYRLARAQLKREVRAGRVLPEDIIAAPANEYLAMTLGELLGAQPRWGTKRTRTFCRAMEVSDRRHLTALTQRQRDVICKRLAAARTSNRRSAA